MVEGGNVLKKLTPFVCGGFGGLGRVCDAAAMLAGRVAGWHPLHTSVSPNKTWEGVVAGVLASILVWLVCRMTLHVPLLLFVCVLQSLGFLCAPYDCLPCSSCCGH